MSRTLAAAQHTIAPLASAVAALVGGDAVDVGPLLPVVRAAGVRAYPGAGADTVDVVALMEVLGRRPELPASLASDDGPAGSDSEQQQQQLLLVAVDDVGTTLGLDPRGAPARHRAARALIDACIIGLESRKLAHGLVATPSSLKASFASPDEARAVLGMVASLSAATVVVVPSSSSSSSSLSSSSLTSLLERLPADRPLHVVVGGGARRLLDVVSPSVRRLRVDLALVGRRGTVVDDDDVYRGLRRLHDDSPATVGERRHTDASEGCWEDDDGAVFFIDGTRLVEDLVDRRARSLVLPLKRARAGIVGVVDDSALSAVLLALAEGGRRVVSLQTLTPSVPADDSADADSGDSNDRLDGLVVDPASGHGWPVASSSSLSVPWLGLLPGGVGGDDGAFMALQGAARARLCEPALPPCRLRRVSSDDDSTAALGALATMVAV